MKSVLKCSFLLTLLLSLNSCFINRTQVGYIEPIKGAKMVKYEKKKQMYVLWGLMALKKPDIKAPTECGYIVKTSFNGIDAIVSFLTVGIFSMRTVKIEVMKDSPCDPKIIRQEEKLEREERHPGR
jgi:Bor protein